MEKYIVVLLAFAAYTSAASISGSASLDPTQFKAGGMINFPKIPGLNAPLFFLPGIFSEDKTKTPAINNPLNYIFGSTPGNLLLKENELTDQDILNQLEEKLSSDNKNLVHVVNDLRQP